MIHNPAVFSRRNNKSYVIKDYFKKVWLHECFKGEIAGKSVYISGNFPMTKQEH